MKNVNTLQGMTGLPARVEQAKSSNHVKSVKCAGMYAILAMLIGYAVQLMNSAGDISVQEKNLIFFASAVTLLMAIPIMALNIYFISRRRASTITGEHSSLRSHWIKKEAAAWAMPIVTIAVLIFLGWGVTH
ncbi:hypothetical protein [Pseudoduganella umbonata]|uniref:Cytochrome o ubiquinol oxidase subunit 2 n=1 Tax=Pseudoduganella umbonata TaxID=864828 RepID=A0A4P8HN76_9BURK|nr:hypothetical protein [Pseudoduganella umbonata]MBB3219813.1 cytochrome o ubiquinol oxidase subunit 2 [Pseudoduganella umbonata]QCP09850.1 hypothetical protein FCL38_04990 [Pseudoduganella umbonata]